MNIRYFLFVCLFGYTIHAEDKNLQLHVDIEAQTYAKISFLVGIIGKKTNELKTVADVIKKDCEFSGQFDVVVQFFPTMKSQQEMAKLYKKGHALAVFINTTDDAKGFEWRLYDLMQQNMLQGKKYTKRTGTVRGWAHGIADALWPLLTGQDGFFSTKIAYCKEVRVPGKKRLKHIFLADYDGSNEELLVASPTVNVAPRWNKDAKMPLLFYSEYTNENVRLMVSSMKKKRKVASNFDGINMLPSFSKDGKKVVYCASRGNGSCQLYFHEKGVFKKITHNRGNNISPTFSDDGNRVFFCSDFKTGRPQLYCYDMQVDNLESLTDGGYCASPSYCAKNNTLAYTKKINRVMQVFTYDLTTKKHTQLTSDSGSKEECSWSPCGNYLLFSVERGGRSRLAIQNLLTNERRFVTSSKQVCSYPAWSPIYNRFPVVS